MPAPNEAPPNSDLTTFLRSEIQSAVKEALFKPGAKDLLSTRVQDFLQTKRDAHLTGKYIEDLEGRIAIFLRIVGDKPVREYDQQDMLRFRKAVDRLPRSRTKYAATADKHRRRRKASLPLIAADRKNDVTTEGKRRKKASGPLISANTADIKYLSPIRNLFGYFVKLHIIEHNPLDGITSKLRDGAMEISAAEERLPFTRDHVRELRAIADTRPQRSPDYWWIRIMPRTGVRLDELAVGSPGHPDDQWPVVH